jgi:hypothetical protein
MLEPDLLGTLADQDQWQYCFWDTNDPIPGIGMPFFNQSPSANVMNQKLYDHMETASSYYGGQIDSSPPPYLDDQSQWVPNAAITFATVNSESGEFAFTLQTPTCTDQYSCSQNAMSNFFPWTFRVLSDVEDAQQLMVHLLERAFLKASHASKPYQPHQWESNSANFYAGNSVAGLIALAYSLTFIMFPLAVSLHLPVYVFR